MRTARGLAALCYGSAIAGIVFGAATGERWALMFAATCGVLGALISIGAALSYESDE